ncbi:MAG: glycosyltransferase [Myxococcota bacterium]
MRPLVLLPALQATQEGSRIGITAKFQTGVEAYIAAWDGPVKVLMERRPSESENLDNVLVDPARLDFELAVVDYGDADLERHFSDAAVVHGSLGYRQNGLPERCASIGVPFVTSSEYTLRTRRQIVRANTANPILRARREFWEAGQERANQRAVRAATGIQCNGTPTYDAYRDVSASALLYFDTRTAASAVLAEDALRERLARVHAGEPLRLAFSGRLDPMKGVQHLVPFARALRDRRVAFTLAICGGGSLQAELGAQIQAAGLQDVVALKGVLDFASELVPFIQREVDLFVCPHVQGDPSCTYMETLACGVPIVGFDNEAFEGIYQLAPVGWTSPLGDAEALANQVVAIDRQRSLLAVRSAEALALATQHTYESTFRARVDHLGSLAK